MFILAGWANEFDAADAALNDQMDALVPQFAAANAKFVEDYNNARIIVDLRGVLVLDTPRSIDQKGMGDQG